MMFRKPIVHVLIVSCASISIIAQKYVGDNCKLMRNGAQGICKLATDCPEVDELAKRGVTPTICGFHSVSIPIVCCEAKNIVQPNENSFLNVDKLETFVFPDSNEPTLQRFKSKSEEKCTEYSKLVTGVVNAVPLITDPEEVSIDIANCDNNGVPLIVGGAPASPGEFPFMGAVGYNDDEGIGWYCGGTLISEFYVVSAGHCANTKYYGPPVKVRLGDLDLKHDDDGTEFVDYDIIEIKIHEQYKPPSRYNDIALFKLSPKVQFTDFIRPACLWTKHNIEHNTSIATGWGKTGVVEDQSDKLLKVALNILDNSLCSRSYPINTRTLPQGITSTMLCAGELKGGKDTCQGDSGGPLLITKQGNRCISYIVGITSFGKGCGGPNLPAIYTRISQYIKWVENIVW